jgi:hypothetical protein
MRDDRLNSSHTGIEYNQREKAKAPADDSSSFLDRDSSSDEEENDKEDIDDNELEIPHDIDFDADDTKTGHTPNAKSSQNGTKSTGVSGATTTSTNIKMSLSPQLTSKMEMKLGRKSGEPSREKLLLELNRVISYRHTIVRAGIKVDKSYSTPSGHNPSREESSYQTRLKHAIPHSKEGVKLKREEAAVKMVRIYSVFFELFREKKFQLERSIHKELGCFLNIMESLRQQCQVDIEDEGAPKNAHAKGLKVSPKDPIGHPLVQI